MITGTSSAAGYLRPAQPTPSPTILTRADALPDLPGADGNAPAAKTGPGIPVSALKKLDVTLTPISLVENQELRDRLATGWLTMQAALSSTEMPDNAPQNTYAKVKVNGKVVATLYNGGSAEMTNAAAAAVGDLHDPPGLMGGPDLAQSRAERIAKALGGTVEKASTAITQSEWKPRQNVTPTYTREQLDAAYDAMTKDMASIPRPRSYGAMSRAAPGADFSA